MPRPKRPDGWHSNGATAPRRPSGPRRAGVATAPSPMAFGWAHDAGVPLNGVLWGSAVFMAVCAWPMCGVLARYGHRPR